MWVSSAVGVKMVWTALGLSLPHGPPLDKDNQVPQAITGWTFCPGLILPTCLLCISHPISNAFFHSAS